MTAAARALVSIIVCSNDDSRYALAAAMYQRLFADEAYELIRIPDARSLCEGYNRGVAMSHGDLLVFSHDDVEILALDLAAKLRFYLGRWDVVGVAGTTRLVAAEWAHAGPPFVFGQVTHPRPEGLVVSLFGAPRRWMDGIQALDGLFFAARRDVVAKVPFDEASFDGFAMYDIDFTFSAHLAGFKLVVANDIQVIHSSEGNFGESWRRYADVFLAKRGPELSPKTGRQWTVGAVLVQTREQVLEVTSPPYWEPLPLEEDGQGGQPA